MLPIVVILIAFLYLFNPKGWSAISTTAHNLSTSGTGTITAAAGQTSEICVFCHTPHGATSERPLWNHQLSSATYSVPSSTDPAWATLLTTVGQPDKASRLCLSCHDGTVAIGALVNMPGPGSIGSVTMTDSGSGSLTVTGELDPSAYGFVGTDLSGTHPVSIAVNDDLIADKNACNTGNSFMLQYPPVGDPVKLWPTDNTYNGNPGRAVTTAAGFSYNEGVQCTSCHDPHDDTNGDFLVKGTPGSYNALCETCHTPLCP
jgi:predicted CXXCH cytochrome family protein